MGSGLYYFGGWLGVSFSDVISNSNRDLVTAGLHREQLEKYRNVS
jgi:hypothetical protein